MHRLLFHLLHRFRLFLFTLALTLPPYCLAQVKIGLSSNADPERSAAYIWAQAFAQILRQNGMEVMIYPGSALGNEMVRTEQVLLGLLEINISGGRELEMISELYATLELPFLFKSTQELSLLIERSDLLERVNMSAEPRGLLLVDFVFLGGMTGLFTAKRPLTKIADTANFRLRAMSTRQLRFFSAWGAAGTQVAWEEVAQALQTGIADGYLNAPMVPVMFGHGNQLDYFTQLRLLPSMRSVVFSASWYAALSSEQQKIVDQAIIHARATSKLWFKKILATELVLLKKMGIEVIELSARERNNFRSRLTPLYPEMADKKALQQITDYLQMIRGSE